MRIALDYDGTYSADPEFWNGFIVSAHHRGHEVVCVTRRHESQAITMPCAVHYTDYWAKVPFVEQLGIKIDIWIDDEPKWLLHNEYGDAR